MVNLKLSKSSPESDLKRYFTAVLELSKSDNQFPINLDEVWPLAYSAKEKAVRALKKTFFQNVDYQLLAQNGENLNGRPSVDYYISLSCMEYFIARKVRPVFEVYRQVFHKAATVKALPKDYAQALRQLLAQVEYNEQLQLMNNDLMPKARIYDEVMQSPQDEGLSTTSSVANEIGMSGQKLNKMLMASGIIYKAKSGDYLFTSEYIGWNLGKVVSTIVDSAKGLVKTYIKWNTRGRAYIHALHDTNWDKRRAWHLLRSGKEVLS